MEAAAELRAAGATWETIGEVLDRKPFVLTRWARVYSDDWRRYLRDAGEWLLRQGSSEWRAKLQALLRHPSSRVRLATADQLLRQRLAEKSAERPPDRLAEAAAFLAVAEKMTDERLQELITDFIRETGFKPTPGTES
jgi:hypothetical protein